MLCRVVLNWNLTPGVYKHEKKSDLHQSIWPEGFYDVRPACSAVVAACWGTHTSSSSKSALIAGQQNRHILELLQRQFQGPLLTVQAMRKFATLKRPVYITETGIADKADTLRAEWAESYFRAVSPSSLHLAACAPITAGCVRMGKALLQHCIWILD